MVPEINLAACMWAHASYRCGFNSASHGAAIRSALCTHPSLRIISSCIHREFLVEEAGEAQAEMPDGMQWRSLFDALEGSARCSAGMDASPTAIEINCGTFSENGFKGEFESIAKLLRKGSATRLTSLRIALPVKGLNQAFFDGLAVDTTLSELNFEGSDLDALAVSSH